MRENITKVIHGLHKNNAMKCISFTNNANNSNEKKWTARWLLIIKYCYTVLMTSIEGSAFSGFSPAVAKV